jgi:hypothetical protein
VHNPGAVPESDARALLPQVRHDRQERGLGLGTYSAQLMARVQEGELSLESSEAAGTTSSRA